MIEPIAMSTKSSASLKGIGFLLVTCLWISGCATSSGSHVGYLWGNYEEDMYAYYHKPENREQVVARHLRLLTSIESKGRVPAPGLYAEAGTFMLESGNREQAIGYYQKEFDAWPESRSLMGKLIHNLQGK